MVKPDDEEESFLVCLPVKGSPPLLVPGSKKTTCTDCQAAVWVSPASFQLSVERSLKIVCIPCADKRAALDDDAKIQMPTEEQLREIRDMIERG